MSREDSFAGGQFDVHEFTHGIPNAPNDPNKSAIGTLLQLTVKSLRCKLHAHDASIFEHRRFLNGSLPLKSGSKGVYSDCTILH